MQFATCQALSCSLISTRSTTLYARKNERKKIGLTSPVYTLLNVLITNESSIGDNFCFHLTFRCVFFSFIFTSRQKFVIEIEERMIFFFWCVQIHLSSSSHYSLQSLAESTLVCCGMKSGARDFLLLHVTQSNCFFLIHTHATGLSKESCKTTKRKEKICTRNRSQHLIALTANLLMLHSLISVRHSFNCKVPLISAVHYLSTSNEKNCELVKKSKISTTSEFHKSAN